jgi:hypothetical protein
MRKIITKSGTTYLLDKGDRVKRLVTGDAAELRRDEDWIQLIAAPHITVGLPMILMLEPLGKGNVTRRTTSPVVSIEEV